MDRTDYKYNLEYRATVRAELASLATDLLDGKLSIIAAARALSRFSDGLEPELNQIINVFVGIDSETNALPVGQERAYWNAQALAQEDKKILSAEEFYRETAITAANQLIWTLKQST